MAATILKRAASGQPLAAATVARVRAHFAEARFLEYLGVSLVELGHGRAVTELRVRPQVSTRTAAVRRRGSHV
jgi:hypothetical protein